MVSKRKTETEGSNESGMVPAVLIEEVRRLIADSRQTVATTINANLTLLYWRIGNRIIVEVLRGERAVYGQQIVASLSRQLVHEYGQSFGEKNLRRMMQCAETFPKEEIVVSLIRQLSWTHFIALLPLKIDRTHEVRSPLVRVAQSRASIGLVFRLGRMTAGLILSFERVQIQRGCAARFPPDIGA